MPESLSNDVFIAYRPDVGGILAKALYQQLTAKSVNAFLDIESIRPSQFDNILIQVAARPYFVLVLTPGTLERCGEPDDWLRREIEQALATGRVIVPVYTPSFNFDDLERFLPTEVGEEVGRFAGQELSQKFFMAAVQLLVEEFLVPIPPGSAPAPPPPPAPPATLPVVPSAPQAPMATECQTPMQGSERSVSQGVRCSRGHLNDPGAVYCATCGVSLVVSADQDWFCPEGHFNPLGGGPACVVCGALMAARMLDHDVQFTVYRPRAMRPRTWERLLVFIHRTEFAEGERDPVEEVRRQAEQVLGTDASLYRSTSQDAGLALPRGDELSLVPQVDSLEFNPPQRSFRWLRDVHREEFDFFTDLPDGTNAHGRLGVYLGSVLIAEVPLSIPVSAAAAGSQPGGPQDIEHARLYRRIFASYAHDDAEVVEQVLAFAAVTGDEFMRDVTHLRAGQDWNEALRDLIRQADLFQLFWSWNSMRSPEVKKEYKYALSLKRPEFIRPFRWQHPSPEPPEDLRAIQFSQLPGWLRADEQPQARLPDLPRSAPAEAASPTSQDSISDVRGDASRVLIPPADPPDVRDLPQPGIPTGHHPPEDWDLDESPWYLDLFLIGVKLVVTVALVILAVAIAVRVL